MSYLSLEIIRDRYLFYLINSEVPLYFRGKRQIIITRPAFSSQTTNVYFISLKRNSHVSIYHGLCSRGLKCHFKRGCTNLWVMEIILNLNNIQLPCSFIKSSFIFTDEANTVHFRFSCTEILKWSNTHVHITTWQSLMN